MPLLSNMVRDTLSISHIVDIDEQPIEIVYQPLALIPIIPLPIVLQTITFAGTNFGNEVWEYDNYYDDYEFSFEECYLEYIAESNARTHFLDVRKQATIDREKTNTQRNKRRTKQLSKKAKKDESRYEEEQHVPRQRKRTSKKSGRRSSMWRDIIVF